MTKEEKQNHLLTIEQALDAIANISQTMFYEECKVIDEVEDENRNDYDIIFEQTQDACYHLKKSVRELAKLYQSVKTTD